MASVNAKGKIEGTHEGGGRSVVSAGSAICKISTEIKDEPQSVTKVVKPDEGSSGTPKIGADTQIEDMTKNDTGVKDAGKFEMNDICKRKENELDQKGTDEMEMAHDSEGVHSSESTEDCSSNERVLVCENQGKDNVQEEISKIESSGDISKDEFDSVSDLVIDENDDNEAEEGKKVNSVSFDLYGSKDDCDNVHISQETCETDFTKETEEMEETVTLTECTTESNDNNLDDDEEDEEDEGEDEEEDDDSYPPRSQNIHRPR